MLLRYRCPTPLHAVRTLLLGNIASPRLDVSPMATVVQAFGGELPEFASSEEVEELMRVLVQGLWNRLSEHQSTRHPFRLPRFEVAPTRQALHDLARVRAQELKGFVDGLFGAEDEMLLPQKAHEAVVALAELHTMFDGAAGLLADETKPAPTHELNSLLRNLQQMTIIADEQINKAVQSCKRARGQRLETMATVDVQKIRGHASRRQRGARRDRTRRRRRTRFHRIPAQPERHAQWGDGAGGDLRGLPRRLDPRDRRRRERVPRVG